MAEKIRKCVTCNRRLRSATGWDLNGAKGIGCPTCRSVQNSCGTEPQSDQEQSSPLYTYIDGVPMLSAEGMSVLFGVPLDEISAEVQRQGGGNWSVPAEWVESGRERTDEYRRSTGGNDMLGALEFWAKRDGKTFELHDEDKVLPDGPLPSQAVIVDDNGVPSAILDVDLIQSAAIRLMYDMAANSGSQSELERISAQYLDEVGVDLFGYVTTAALKFMTSNVLEPTLEVLDAVAPEMEMRVKLTESAINARLA
ncbi:hypothetical protein [Rhodococcus sp. BH5]|uniref:hypothetical protein n=1 Tax=Rhodococcus sp. BH5 TaxID=2871702 RepID=UPI0022CD3640|nr:hypothetical protein [Rhodococcus sp. BH5]MCZ9635285.1 hypothetical protein [Rhodococcus sp. BH5]